jgi:hypothetical protein
MIGWELIPAAASAYSAASGHMRVICSDYDQLLAAAKMAGNDDASIGGSRLLQPGGQSQHLAAAKKEFKAGCPRLAALTAFLWLGWIAYTVTLLWTLYLATRPEAVRLLTDPLRSLQTDGLADVALFVPVPERACPRIRREWRREALHPCQRTQIQLDVYDAEKRVHRIECVMYARICHVT